MRRRVAQVQHISPHSIQKNPENPRLIFREGDLYELLQSIKSVGIQVPLTVYWDDDTRTYVILDGERRWTCALKLNLPELPAIVQNKPTRLENLLMMFNIHNVRIAWDLLPMAMKLDTVRQLLLHEGKPAEIKDLAAITGLSLSTVRRALDLLTIPQKYQELLLQEAEKPREKQEVTADLFIEIYKSFHALERYIPELTTEYSPDIYVESMVEKYRRGVIRNVTHFRNVSRIARAELAGTEIEEVITILKRLIVDPLYSIEDAYAESVKSAYEERDVLTRVESLQRKLEQFDYKVKPTGEIRESLKRLLDIIKRLIEA